MNRADVVVQVEHWATRAPDRVAITAADETLTYGELDRVASALAARLRAAGVGPEDRVVALARRRPRHIAALLAVMKAGAAYVPVDPDYPPDRIRYAIDDSAAGHVLCDSETVGSAVLNGCAVAVMNIDDPVPAASFAAVDVAADQLAYVIYTSGSTGRPKGVMVSRHAMNTLIGVATHFIGAHRLSTVLAATSFCFDVSVFEVFAPLCVGGRLVLVDDPISGHELMEGADVQLICAVPSALAQQVAFGLLPTTTRTIVAAGEALPPALAQQLLAAPGVESVVNAYGPTETTVYVTAAHIGPDTDQPPIGAPFSSVCCYVLDERLDPLPSGEPGELFIGGEQVARGYLGRPGLTGERFLPDPFAGVPGARMYRTGDRVRRRGDGELEFLGRCDNQVKLRGYRIELGEIEHALAAYPGVVHAAALVREDMPGGPRLVGYVTAAEQPAPQSNQLRAFLHERLPAYMVPNMFVVLESMPTTVSGKVDRKALPRPEQILPWARVHTGV